MFKMKCGSRRSDLDADLTILFIGVPTMSITIDIVTQITTWKCNTNII